MTISLTHSHVATSADDPDAEVNKAEWNDEHVLTQGTARVLGRTTASAGATEELTVTAPLALGTGTITTSMSSGKLLGRSTAGTGVIEEITVGTNLTLSGGTLSASGGGSGSAHPTFISGLQVTWVSATALNVELGSAYVPSVADAVDVSAVINLTSISLGNSAWGYVYLKNDGTAECVTTAPAAAYAGHAQAKTADNTRRLLMAVKTDGSGNIFQFQHNPLSGEVFYQAQNSAASPFRVLTNGSATTSTAVSCAAAAPPQSRMALLRMTNLSTTEILYVGSGAYTVTTTAFEAIVAANVDDPQKEVQWIGADSSQQVNYTMSGASNGAYIDVLGFQLLR